jgi:hypothetical protein
VHHATGVFGDVAGTMEIKLNIEDGGATVTRTARASEREALGLLVFKFRIRDGFKHVKVTNKSELEQLVEFIETDVEVLRHQWVIGGGETLRRARTRLRLLLRRVHPTMGTLSRATWLTLALTLAACEPAPPAAGEAPASSQAPGPQRRGDGLGLEPCRVQRGDLL